MKINYNPDVLSCLANLSNDEVFTPPDLVNEILDMLPGELWEDPEAKFLDPACKSGVFLREIAKRLIKGLEEKIPDKQERSYHILKKQLYGIATIELTSLISRRTLYCSKTANGKYSVCEDFNDENGNIYYQKIQHTWANGKCIFCGASQSVYDRDDSLETHAYNFIHTDKPEEIFNMKFDVIIGNPPYQLETGGTGKQAKPIYNKFVEQAKKLSPKYLIMIIPSRWFAGGMGLDSFRNEMMNDKRIRVLTDYSNAKDCFPGISLSGGVNYFLWEYNYSGPCTVNNIHDGSKKIRIRYLNEFPVLVRYNEAVSIIKKVSLNGEKSFSDIVSSIDPFGFATSERGNEKKNNDLIKLYSSGGVGYVEINDVNKGRNLIDKHKVMISQTTSEHAGEPGKDGKFKLFSTIKVLLPNEICTFSYIIAGPMPNENNAKNLKSYLSTKFARLLVLQAVSSIHLSREKFIFLPIQDFNETWTDEKLYKKYGLTEEEIAFIDSMIRPMDLSDNGESDE